MSAPQNLGQLSESEWQQLQEFADRYHAAWRNGPPELEEFLPPADHPLRRVVLQELITIDLEMRWRLGQPLGLEYYLEKYPEVGPSTALPPTLIFQEYHVRHRFGDRPALAGYQQRFPDQFEEVSRLAMHETKPRSAADGSVPTPSSAQSTPPAASEVSAPEPPPAASAEEPAPKEQATVIGDYTLRRKVGSAAFGEVWAADAPGGVPVAIKILFRPVDAEEAQRELAALELIKRLRHPCLVQLHRYWSSQERVYVVMELAEGSLRDRLEQCRAEKRAGIPQDELLRYFRAAAEGLDFLHGQKVLHRDIKPENILLVQGHAKLADFGLAREQGSRMLSTATGAGTPLYMAPEVFRSQVGPSSDQYSLAMAYAELRLDRRLLSGVNLVELMMQHLEGTPDLSGLPEAEQRVILKALSKDPARRYPSCLAWVAALEEARAGGGAPALAVQRRDDDAVALPAPPTVTTNPYETLGPESLPKARAVAEQSRRRVGRDTGVMPAEVDQTVELPQPVKVPEPAKVAESTQPTEPLAFRRLLLVASGVVLLLAVGGVLAGGFGYALRYLVGPPKATELVAVADTRHGGGPLLVPGGSVPESPPPRDTVPAPRQTSPEPKATERDRPPPVVVKDTKPANPPPVVPKETKPETKPPPVTPILALEAPAALTMGTGQKLPMGIRITRNFDEPVRVTVANLPAGVNTDPEDAPVPAGKETVDVPLSLKAAPNATTGTGNVVVRAEGAGLKREAKVKLLVLWLPPKFVPAGPETITDGNGLGRTYFRRIRREFGGGLSAEFVLIPRNRPTDPDTFYMMIDKATVGVFHKFVDFQKKRGETVHAGWNESADDGYPVFDVRVEDAHACAEWLSGRLPSPREWDKAAGFFDRANREGPFIGKWGGARRPQVAVGRGAPEKAGAARDDVSVFECRDMAGNGWEWTNQVQPGGRQVPVDGARSDRDFVQLRGHSFREKEPLFFRDMEEPGRAFRRAPYHQAQDDLSFRIVIEPKS
jgi:hypothetical protein